MRISDWSSDVCSSDLGAAAANQRQRRREAGHLGEAVEQAVLRAEDHRGPEDDRLRKGGPNGGFALGLAAGIGRGGVRRGTDGGDVELGRASCWESVSVRVDLGGRRISKNK